LGYCPPNLNENFGNSQPINPIQSVLSLARGTFGKDKGKEKEKEKEKAPSSLKEPALTASEILKV
jgi:hypothetical protein